MFPHRVASGEEARWSRGTLLSKRMEASTLAFMARHSLSYAGLLLAAFATVVARYAGLPFCALMANFGGRTNPRLQEAVGTFVLPGPIFMEVGQCSLPDLARLAQTKLVTAYRAG